MLANITRNVGCQTYLQLKTYKWVRKKQHIWQFSQHLKQHFAEQGISVKVFVTAYVSVNGKASKPLIDSKVDLANEEWQHFKHHDWILPSK